MVLHSRSKSDSAAFINPSDPNSWLVCHALTQRGRQPLTPDIGTNLQSTLNQTSLCLDCGGSQSAWREPAHSTQTGQPVRVLLLQGTTFYCKVESRLPHRCSADSFTSMINTVYSPDRFVSLHRSAGLHVLFCAGTLAFVQAVALAAVLPSTRRWRCQGPSGRVSGDHS